MDENSILSDDVNEVANNIIKIYEGLTGRTLFPADPIRLFLLSIATIIVQLVVIIQNTSKGNYLRYAQREQLDALGDLTETKRLEAGAAVTTMEFRLSMPLTSATIIPPGTRIGPQGGDGQLFFNTNETIQILEGELTGTVTAECSDSGTSGNGFLPGQINVLIDPIPFVQSVKNITTSSGGAAAEDDSSYRERIRTAPEQFSTAGPEGAYQYWAKTASSSIIDIAVHSPAAGEVVIVPLMQNGDLPSTDILEAVEEAVTDRKRRPLTDNVTVTTPTQKKYDVNIKYWIDQDRAAESAAIQAAVTAAVNEYCVWQKSKLGRDVNPSELIWRVMNAGALRVEVTSPIFTKTEKVEVAKDDGISIVFGGLEDD